MMHTSVAEITNDVALTIMYRPSVTTLTSPSLRGALRIGGVLYRFWAPMQLYPASPLGTAAQVYSLDPSDAAACQAAEMWALQVLGYDPIVASADMSAFPATQRVELERFVRSALLSDMSVSDGSAPPSRVAPEGLHRMLVSWMNDGSVSHSGAIDHALAPRVAPSVPVLISAFAPVVEKLSKILGLEQLSVDGDRTVFRASAWVLRRAALAGVAALAGDHSFLGVPVAALAADYGDDLDVIAAANRLYQPQVQSPYGWFQVAMNDVRRLGAKVR